MGGRTSTHVANAFNEPIYVKVDAEQSRLIQSREKVDESATVFKKGSPSTRQKEVHQKFHIDIIEAGFSLIQPQRYLRFDVVCDTRKTVYISVFYVKNNEPIWIANALSRAEDRSVIITEEPQLVDAKYGSVWQRAN